MLLLLLLLKFYTYHVDTHAMIYSTVLLYSNVIAVSSAHSGQWAVYITSCS